MKFRNILNGMSNTLDDMSDALNERSDEINKTLQTVKYVQDDIAFVSKVTNYWSKENEQERERQLEELSKIRKRETHMYVRYLILWLLMIIGTILLVIFVL